MSSPLENATFRGKQYKDRLLNDEGGVVSAAQVAEALGISGQAVDKRRRAGQLIGLSTGRRGYAFPLWQFGSDGGTLPGLEAVLDALRGYDPWMQLSFMLNSNLRLDDRRPLDLLRDGEVERVREAAVMFGEHGAS